MKKKVFSFFSGNTHSAVVRSSFGRAFHAVGPAIENRLDPNFVRLHSHNIFLRALTKFLCFESANLANLFSFIYLFIQNQYLLSSIVSVCFSTNSLSQWFQFLQAHRKRSRIPHWTVIEILSKMYAVSSFSIED